MSNAPTDSGERLSPENAALLDRVWGCRPLIIGLDALIDAARAEGAALSAVSGGGGWRLVPVAATEAMLRAFHDGPLGAGEHVMDAKQIEWITECWAAMLAAAPKPPLPLTGREEIAHEIAPMLNRPGPDAWAKGYRCAIADVLALLTAGQSAD